jgi:hypothetical protein
MAKKDFTAQSGTLAEIQKSLEEIDQAAKVLVTLAQIKGRIDGAETVTLAIDTLFTLGCDIEARVDSVFYHLNRIQPDPQAPAAPEGGK